jgi:hypothetical protein
MALVSWDAIVYGVVDINDHFGFELGLIDSLVQCLEI